MTAIERVRKAAAALSAATGCPITVDVENNPEEVGFGLYVPDGWHWVKTECHTSLNLTPRWTDSMNQALADIRGGVVRVTEED